MGSDLQEKWNPLSRARFDEILADEVASLPPDALKMYERYATGVMEHPCNRGKQYGVESVFVVARADSRMLLFDDAEDEFAIGVPRDDGVLTDWSLYGELVFAIRNLKADTPPSS
jgi:hypothetical protein